MTGFSRHARVAVLMAVVALTLSGCLRFTSDLEVHQDDTVSGAYVIAVVTGTGQQVAMTDRELSEELWGDTGLGAALADAHVEDYSADGYTGIKVSFEKMPLSAFAPTDQHWGIAREGDEFVVSGLVSGGAATSGADEDGDDAPAPDVRVELTFPGPVTQANGAIAGRTVSWIVTEDQTGLSARASATPASDRASTLAFLVLGIVVVTGIAYWLAGVIGRSRRHEPPRAGRIEP